MKVLTIVFSQTGGTEKIAKKIQEGIVKSGNNCELVKIKEVDLTKLDEYELIGLGCPTFFYREPSNVRSFIQTWDSMEGKHCFIFATHGSNLGNTFYYMKEELEKKGLVVIGAFDSYSESSLQFYPKIVHTAGHPDEIELKEAQEFGENLCALSLKIQSGESNLIPSFELAKKTWWARAAKMMTPQILKKISPKFKINMEKCTKCMVCQDNCPVDAIDIEKLEIQKEGCLFCWFCEKACPAGAIEADWSFMRENLKWNLKNYVKDLKKAELQGRFRPYVDYESIQ